MAETRSTTPSDGETAAVELEPEIPQLDPNRREKIEPPAPEGLRRFFPFLEWSNELGWSGLLADLRAGFFLAILLIPQAMAYAQLAGLSAAVGLRAALIAPLAYVPLGTSRHLAVGPVALVSLLVAEGIQSVSGQTEASPERIAVTLAVMVGVLLLSLGLLRFGFLANFLSAPVLVGFLQAAAVIIAASQLPKLLGLVADRENSFVGSLVDLLERSQNAHLPTLALGAAALVVLLVGRGPLAKWLQRAGLSKTSATLASNTVPMLVVVAAIAVSWMLDLDDRGVATVSTLGATSPKLTLPIAELSLWRELAPSALLIALVGFVTALAVGQSLAQRRRERVMPDQELLALGACNVLTAMFSGYAVGGSMSRSAVAFESGGRSPFTGLFASGIVLAASLLAGPTIAHLPFAVLAAIVLAALAGFVRPSQVVRIWRFDRREGQVLLLTFFAVLFVGVELGLIGGAAVALSLHLWRTSHPRFVVEAPHRQTDDLRSTEHAGVEERETHPILVMRLDEALCFANTRYVERTVLEALSTRADVLCLLLDFRAVNHIDFSGIEMLERLVDELQSSGVSVAVADIREPTLRGLERCGLIERLGEKAMFSQTATALEALHSRYHDREDEAQT